MASESEVEEVLITLQAAYPSYKPVSVGAMVDIYTKKLSRFPIGALKQAVDQVIDESKFFPAISELVGKASRIRQPVVLMPLEERRQALEDRYYQDGEFDPAEWRSLAQDFARAGRGEGAAAIERRREAILESEREPALL
jgi:Loader and inhibitor of phage G40P